MRTPPAAFAAEGLPPSATTSLPSSRPQSAQNFAPGAFSELQFEQRFDSGLPHSAQNFLPGLPSVPHFEPRILRSPLIEQSLGILQIDGIETFGEPAVDFSEHRARLVATALLLKQPREACRRAQLPRFGLLTPRDLDRPPQALPTFEPLHSALTGMLRRTGGEGNPPDHYLTHMDYGCGLTSCAMVLAALVERERSGVGQYLEVPQTGAGLFAMSDVYGTAQHKIET